MTWYYEISADKTQIDVYDHTKDPATDEPTITVPVDSDGIGFDSQGIPVEPDIRKDIVEGIRQRGNVDLFALRTIAEALTGADFERIRNQ